MKRFILALAFLVAAFALLAITQTGCHNGPWILHAQGEQPIAGDRRGNRCFNGTMWKYCNEVEVVRPQWKFQYCQMADCITSRLNSLSPEHAVEAHLVAAGSGIYIWYRDER